MPTGYTAKLCEQDVSFREFALTCARNFGALVEMRDESLSAEVPAEFQVSPYHIVRLEEAKAKLRRVENMTLGEADARAAEEYDVALTEHRRAEDAKAVTRKRLLDMRQSVRDWSPPSSEHDGLKDFMLEQIEITMAYDTEPRVPPRQLSGREWLQGKIKSLYGNISYHTKAYVEDMERTDERNRWLRLLRESLPSEEVSDALG